MTYMNLSGQPLRAISDFYKITPAEAMVVTDDMALPLGKLRLRPRGGPGGHNGLESVICELGTEEIPRLRVGIGAPRPNSRPIMCWAASLKRSGRSFPARSSEPLRRRNGQLTTASFPR